MQANQVLATSLGAPGGCTGVGKNNCKVKSCSWAGVKRHGWESAGERVLGWGEKGQFLHPRLRGSTGGGHGAPAGLGSLQRGLGAAFGQAPPSRVCFGPREEPQADGTCDERVCWQPGESQHPTGWSQTPPAPPSWVTPPQMVMLKSPGTRGSAVVYAVTPLTHV